MIERISIMIKVKRTAAMIGVILIASLYLLSFISALFASESAPGLFLASIFSTAVIPIMIYIYVEVYKWVHKNDIPKDIDETSSTKAPEITKK